MRLTNLDRQQLTGYTLIILGFTLLIINHITVLLGNPLLIPGFLRLY
jgi:hypothetical protein